MKNKKKFGRKLALNKQTIASLSQQKVVGGRTTIVSECLACPCGQTIETEVICSLVDCYTINTPTCQTCETCGELTCECTVNCTDNCTNARIPCPCQEPLTY
jgi:hypothetical protein